MVSGTPDLPLRSDIRLGDFAFNQIDNYGVAWIIEDVEGWWYPPESAAPDDPLPDQYDGSYDSSGRYLPRQIIITGKFYPPTGAPATEIEAARERLIQACNLSRQTDLLQVDESNPKQARVRYIGGMKIATTKLNGQTEFSIPLRSVDPRKYSTTESTVTILPNSGVTQSGRTYNQVYNKVYQSGSSSTSTTGAVQNIGYYNTTGTITFVGPITDPGIECIETGSILQFKGLVLNQGSTLVVSLANRTATVNGVSDARRYLTVTSKWFTFLPGTTTVRYLGFQQVGPTADGVSGFNYVLNPDVDSSTAGSTLSFASAGANILGVTSAVTTDYRLRGSTSAAVAYKSIGWPSNDTASRVYAESKLGLLTPLIGSATTMSVFVFSNPTLATAGFYFVPEGTSLWGEAEIRDASDALITRFTGPLTSVNGSPLNGTSWTRWRLATFTMPAGAHHGTMRVGLQRPLSTAIEATNFAKASDMTNSSRTTKYYGYGSGTQANALAGGPTSETFVSTTLGYAYAYSTTSNVVTVATSTTSGFRAFEYPASNVQMSIYPSVYCRVSNMVPSSSVTVTVTYNTYNASNTLVQTNTGTATFSKSSTGPDPSWFKITTTPVTVDMRAGGFYSTMTVSMTKTGTASTEQLNVAQVSATNKSTYAYIAGNVLPYTYQGTAFESASTATVASVYFDEFQMELNSSPSTYFDGYSDGASWEGTPNNSRSIVPATPGIPSATATIRYRSAWI